MMHQLYLLINIFSVSVPFLFSFHPRLKFYKRWKYFFPANLIAAVIFLFFDSLFTQWGVWGFNENYITGIAWLHLPLEEILFFICIPYACVFTYHCISVLFNAGISHSTERMVVSVLSISLLATGTLYFNRLYTSSTFVTLGIFLVILHFMLRVSWLGRFLVVYAFLLIPFFIVNGILTGTGIEEPVVWYNNSENLGVRLLTIPVEDIFYGMALILLNVFLYEGFANRSVSGTRSPIR